MPSKLVLLSWDDAGFPAFGLGRPDNSLPGGPVYPGQGLPGGPVYPGQGLPIPPNYVGGGPVTPPVHIWLPVYPFDPSDNKPPEHVDNTPPVPGKKYIVKWLACQGLILVPEPVTT